MFRMRKRVAAVKKYREIGKQDMRLNNALLRIEVDPETYVLKAVEHSLKSDPLPVLSMA